MDYTGKLINKNPPQPTQASASGVWTLDEAAAAVKNNSWPIPGVPNPISKSLRFNSADSAYLNWTPSGSATSSRKLTYSCWVKRATLSAYQHFGLTSAVSGSSRDAIRFQNTDTINVYFNEGASYDLYTAAVFRDVSAWYHVVVAVDTTQATAANRVRIYVNNVEQTLTGTQPAQNYDFTGWLVSGKEQNIGRNTSGSFYFGGYETEVYCIDGQQLTPSSFGQTNANTGVWEPKPYTGTYGANGFYLNFKDSATTTALGYDYSGNGNNWTPNNFSVTAGAGNDSLVDVPTQWIGYNTSGDTGGIWRGNYCTMNPLANNGGTLANGNLDHTGTTALTTNTLFPTSGKWYCELTCTAYGGGASLGYTAVGVIQSSQTINTIPNSLASVPAGLWIYRNDAYKANNGASASYGNTWTANDVIGIAIDIDAGKVWFAKNGTWQASGDPAAGTNAAYTNLSGAIGVAINNQGSYSSSYSCNFGQRPFAYAPPAGFLSLCTTNLPTPTIGATSTTQAGKYFNTVLYTGTGSSLGVTGVGFQPDWTWIKSRSAATDHGLYDAVRGVQKQLESNNTDAETTETTGLTAFNSDGFTVGALAQLNTNTATYVGWNWKANGAGSSNNAGTITSTVSANTTAGFSIVTYTGTGSNATVGHGCLVNGVATAPSMMIFKGRNTAYNWIIYHSALPISDYLDFTTAAATNGGSAIWNSTAPTSTVFSIGTQARANDNGQTTVAYCFAPVAGYSAFGSYTGNGSADGPFVYTGFKPAWVLVKQSSAAGEGWRLIDATRSPYNVANRHLLPNSAAAESTETGWDMLSNGFKLRSADAHENANGATYIYAAFAENPFKYSLAR